MAMTVDKCALLVIFFNGSFFLNCCHVEKMTHVYVCMYERAYIRHMCYACLRACIHEYMFECCAFACLVDHVTYCFTITTELTACLVHVFSLYSPSVEFCHLTLIEPLKVGD